MPISIPGTHKPERGLSSMTEISNIKVFIMMNKIGMKKDQASQIKYLLISIEKYWYKLTYEIIINKYYISVDIVPRIIII